MIINYKLDSNMKKIFFVVLLSLLSLKLFAYDFCISSGGCYLYYDYNAGINGYGVTLVDGSSLPANLTIPNRVYYNGRYYAVTAIGQSAFSGETTLTSIFIPNTVTSIGSNAFLNCTGISSLTIPFSVTYINISAFSGCSGLTSISVDPYNTVYDSRSNCNAIIETATNTLICGCQNTIIPISVTCIGSIAFKDCTGLTAVTIPDSVTNIGFNAFGGCTGLTTVNYNAVNCVSTAIVFSGSTNLDTFNFGSSVTRIPPYLCYGLIGLTSVSLPNSLSVISASAFYGCTGLTSITIPPSVTNIGDSAFQGCSGLTSVTIPPSVTNIGNSAFKGCSGLTSVTIPNAVDSIGSSAFYDCTCLTTINFNADSCTYVGTYGVSNYIHSYYAFQGCPIMMINFGNNVTTIPQALCYGHSSLLSVTIPNSVTSIGNKAFYGCSGLTSITIPPLVTSIGNSAFSGCTGLRLVEFNADSCLFMANPPSGSSSTTLNVFNNTDIRTISIGGNVKIIPPYAFYGCNHISSITIPDSVRAIGVQAFSGCSSLDTVNLFPIVPPSVGSNTFSSSVDRFNVRCDAYTAYYSSTQWLTYRSRLRSYFYPNIEVTVSSSNPTHGTVAKVMQGGRYVSCDSLCIISATNNYGYHFDHWSNGRMTNPDTLHLMGDSNIVAYFAPNQYAVYGVPNYPDRGFVLGNDTVDYLDTVLLTAVANHGYMFDHWSDGAYENPHSVVVNGNRTITAYFVPALFTLSVISSDLNMGTVSGGGNYDYQSSRTIRAIANTGYHFTHWNDGDVNNNRTITLTQDTSFTAYFAPNQYTLTLQSADESLGIVTGGGEYAYLDTVTVFATVTAPHYHFERWSDNNTDNPRQYVITGNATLTAYFALDVHSVVVQVDDMAHGTVSGGGNYTYGSAATIAAETPFSGWVFSHWSDGATYNPYTFAVLQDTVMTAYFVREGSQNGVDGVDTMSAKIYVNNGQIVVEGAEGNPVYLYDVVGRLLATRRETMQEVLLDVPASGAYLVKIGDAPALRVVVRR